MGQEFPSGMGIQIVKGGHYLGGYIRYTDTQAVWLWYNMYGYEGVVNILVGVVLQYLQAAYSTMKSYLQQEWFFCSASSPQGENRFSRRRNSYRGIRPGTIPGGRGNYAIIGSHQNYHETSRPCATIPDSVSPGEFDSILYFYRPCGGRFLGTGRVSTWGSHNDSEERLGRDTDPEHHQRHLGSGIVGRETPANRGNLAEMGGGTCAWISIYTSTVHGMELGEQ